MFDGTAYHSATTDTLYINANGVAVSVSSGGIDHYSLDSSSPSHSCGAAKRQRRSAGCDEWVELTDSVNITGLTPGTSYNATFKSSINTTSCVDFESDLTTTLTDLCTG